MKCPKCHAIVTANPDPSGFFNCSGCGIKLKVPPKKAASEDQKTTTRVTRPPSAGEASEGPPTLVPSGAPRKPPAPKPAPAPPAAPAFNAQLDVLLKEIREVRRLQELMLQRLEARPAPVRASAGADEDIETVDADDLAPPPRAGDILLVDDQEESRKAAERALAASGLAVRMITDGNKVLEAIAERSPAAIVLEAELGGTVPARDLIDRIKATMEWVNIPIVLYTRRQIADVHEARTQFGADGFVVKGPGSDVLLAGRVQEVINR